MMRELLNQFRHHILCQCAPSGARFSRVKIPNPPGSGKDIAEGKGVGGAPESKGTILYSVRFSFLLLP